MRSKRGRSKSAHSPASARKPALRASPAPSSPRPAVSVRWLAAAAGIAIVAAVACAWGTLCFLFWQGSWQLLYHPAAPVVRTPANAGLAFDSVGFATAANGVPQLHGWWIPAGPTSRYTAIYLHGANGNLGDSVDAFTPLHRAGLNVFAFDYRGYGQSHFKRPSEARLREDAGSAIEYLTNTRHLPASSIVLVGRDLGANLALEIAAAHPELAGVVLENPLEAPTATIFSDPRAHLVPAHALVRDRWDLNAPAANLRISSLWFYWTLAKNIEPQENAPNTYEKVTARKSLVWLTDSPGSSMDYNSALSRWLDDLPAKVNTH